MAKLNAPKFEYIKMLKVSLSAWYAAHNIMKSEHVFKIKGDIATSRGPFHFVTPLSKCNMEADGIFVNFSLIWEIKIKNCKSALHSSAFKLSSDIRVNGGWGFVYLPFLFLHLALISMEDWGHPVINMAMSPLYKLE